MATKAELEAELAKLRSEMSALKSAPRANSTDTGADENGAKDGENPSVETRSDSKPSKAEMTDVIESLREGDLESVVQTLMDELEGLPSRKPLLTALGAFIVGYLIGRSGSKG